MKRYLLLGLLAVMPVAKADSINVVAQELRQQSEVPFRFGVANDLAGNLLTAQSLAWYAGPVSLELSIEAVIRAIGLEATSYVGWYDTNPVTWTQSRIAIDPNASIEITPKALEFGAVNVVEPNPITEITLGIVVGAVALFVSRLLRGKR